MAKAAAKKCPKVPVIHVKRTKLKGNDVQTEVARIVDCEHLEINVAETSRAIHALFLALGTMIHENRYSQFAIQEYLNDQLEKGLALAQLTHTKAE